MYLVGCPDPEHNSVGSLAQTCQFFVCLVWAVSAKLNTEQFTKHKQGRLQIK